MSVLRLAVLGPPEVFHDGNRLTFALRKAQALLILSRHEKLSEEQRRDRDTVLQAHPEVNTACLLAQAFAQVIRTRNVNGLEPWIQQAIDSGVPELGSFVGGIRRDQAAVFAALTYPWSQGQVEGQIHRLKLLKRQSYGQAGFGLLRHRVLARPA
jgi:transposase